jgi:hypothetical protein
MKYTVFLIILIITIFLIYAFQAEKADRYIGTIYLSDLNFEGEMGQEIISSDSTRTTVIVWFHPECEHCRYQLDEINDNIRRLQAARFLFITDERAFFAKKFNIAWPDLVQSSHAIFGIIDRSKFIDEFGPVITPSLLFFNHRGILKEKLLGEVKFEKIVQMINKHPVPEQMMSGSN